LYIVAVYTSLKLGPVLTHMLAVFSTGGELDLPTAVLNFGVERCSRPAGV
jgi:hypothetical protein